MPSFGASPSQELPQSQLHTSVCSENAYVTAPPHSSPLFTLSSGHGVGHACSAGVRVLLQSHAWRRHIGVRGGIGAGGLCHGDRQALMPVMGIRGGGPIRCVLALPERRGFRMVGQHRPTRRIIPQGRERASNKLHTVKTNIASVMVASGCRALTCWTVIRTQASWFADSSFVLHLSSRFWLEARAGRSWTGRAPWRIRSGTY